MKSKDFTVHNMTEMQELANLFAKDYLLRYRKIFFYGEMGVGKTTFIKMLCKALGVEENTSSPTFALVNHYSIKDKSFAINHADLYRLRDAEEAFNAGLYELFFDEDYFFVEWPEKVETFVVDNVLKITIVSDEEDCRFVKVQET